MKIHFGPFHCYHRLSLGMYQDEQFQPSPSHGRKIQVTEPVVREKCCWCGKARWVTKYGRKKVELDGSA